MAGWIKLHRQICDHPFYKERRVFSRLEAWVDLLFLANHKDHRFLLGSEIVEAKRGEVITSELTLMERWRWSKSKVRRYIKNLEDERMVIKKADNKKTRLFIINYDAYQRSETAEEPQKDHGKTTERPQTIHNQERKNEKKEKNEKEKDSPLPPSGGALPPRTPGYSNDGTVCFIPDGPEDYEYLTQAWNYFLADVGKQAGDEKIGLTPVALTPERIALIEERVREWPDLFMAWISIISRIGHSPFMLGENREGWKANFDWVLKPRVAMRIYEEDPGQLNVLKSLRDMDTDKESGATLQLEKVPASSPGNGNAGEFQEPEIQEDTPEGPTEGEPAVRPEDQPPQETTPEEIPEPPKEKAQSLEDRRESYKKGSAHIREFLSGKRPSADGQ